MAATEGRRAETAIWQEVEFGAYREDLPLWEEIAREADGPVLELGAGSGRVSAHLARSGIPVIALDRDPALVEELRRRRESLPLTALAFDLADAVSLPDAVAAAGERPGAAIAPLHLIQQVEPGARAGLLAALAGLLPAGGRVALTVVDESSLTSDGGVPPEVPDMRDESGWVYASEPLWVQLDDERMTVRRLRRRVSPAGEIERTVHDELLHRLAPDALEDEAAAAGLHPLARRPILSGPDEADSIAVILEAR